ncbi:MAG: alpha/beta hydrolase [Vulcanimicrobiaceae bacterium]
MQINYGDYPSLDVPFDRDAHLAGASAQDLVAFVDAHEATDLVVVSHGWNNDIPEAVTLYEALFARIRVQAQAQAQANLRGRTFAIAAVFWPSKRFTDESAIPGGAAGLEDVQSGRLQATLDNLRDLFDARGQHDAYLEAKSLVARLDDETAQDRFVAILGALLGDAGEPDHGIDQLPGMLRAPGGHELLQALQGATVGAVVPVAAASGGDGFDSGGAADLPDVASNAGTMAAAAGLGGVFTSLKDAALGLLNVTTYATMKDRAGLIGRSGLAPVLERVVVAHPNLRLHLIGHSFGGRLVTAATAAAAKPVSTLSLLQAAYSHYGLAEKFDGTHDGFFRNVVAAHKVRGPIVITHTVRDLAVGLAYPIVSRLLGQNANAVGDRNDPFGGLGRNGAQKTPEVPNADALLLAAGAPYDLRDGVPNNLNGDAIITGHGDIARDEVAWAVLAAIART